MSEPVSQATLRIVKVFWGLSYSLAYKRHFPAIDWLVSYSLYDDKLKNWFVDNVSSKFGEIRQFVSTILQEENELLEIVRLVGSDSLSYEDRITMETAKMIREDFLHQNAFHEIDTFTSIQKQFKMLNLIYDYYRLSKEYLKQGVGVREILNLETKEKISRAKLITEENLKEFDNISKELVAEFKSLTLKSEEV